MDKVAFTALAWLALIALVATGALLRVRPHERLTFLNTLWLFFLGIAGQAGALTLLTLDLPRAAGTVQTVFRILTAVALIRLFGFVAVPPAAAARGQAAARASSRTSPSCSPTSATAWCSCAAPASTSAAW